MATVGSETILESGGRRKPAVSWGAIFAGLVLVTAAGWLMVLLGSAIGFSIADASDAEAMGEGFGFGAIIWMILTFVIAYFLGGLIAGRLAGHPDRDVGMLHGVTLWGLATIVSVWLGAAGISGIAQMGYAAVQGVAQVGSAVTSGVGAVGSAAGSLSEQPIFDRVTAILKRQARESVAKSMAGASGDVSPEEARQSLSEVDDEVLREVGSQLLDGDMEGAKATLASRTTLSTQEIDSLIEAANEEMKSQIPGSSPNESALAAAQDYMSRRIGSIVANADQPGGPDVDSQEVSQAIQGLDADTMQRVAMAIIEGDAERAKDILASNTSLNEEQIGAVVQGVQAEAQQQIDEVKQEVAAAAETASTYATTALWTLFVASALALIATIIGGWLGADTVHRLYVVDVKTTT